MVRSFRICLRHICSTGLGVRNHRATLGDGLVVAAGWLRTGRPGERAAGSHRCQAVDDATLHRDAVPPAGAGGYQLPVDAGRRANGPPVAIAAKRWMMSRCIVTQFHRLVPVATSCRGTGCRANGPPVAIAAKRWMMPRCMVTQFHRLVPVATS
jgi:hypothetical protein